MKRLTGLWQVMVSEVGTECGISIERDYKTLLTRVEHEGLSFLTITLPTFCSDFERSLDLGYVASDAFLSFKKRGGLPVFLSGFLKLVFEDDGSLKESPSIPAIRGVRQVTAFFKKIEIECTDRRKAKSIESYITCEKELHDVKETLSIDQIRKVALQAHVLFGDVFDKINRKVDSFDLHPVHGSGATADRKVGNQKFEMSVWTDRLEKYFPFGEYVLPNWRHYSSWPVSFQYPEQEQPAKVVLVPKTQKTPRLIAEEPTHMQYMQQALMRELVPLLEGDHLCGPLVGFSSQEENRNAAREGSLTGSLATLDLSEASDRVLNVLVEEILSPWPSLQGAVMACRSERVQLPTGEVIPLTKFASMGSALCFPFEEIVFLSILLSGWHTSGANLSRAEVMNLHGRVRVYGDDIIIPVEMVQSSMEALEAFGLKVNRHKSFWNGKFRESCGGDYYDGEWVTPVRLSRMLPERRGDIASIVSTMELSNLLYENGYWRTSRYLLEGLQKLRYGQKVLPRFSGALGPWSFQKELPWDSIHKDYQFKVVRVDVVVSPVPSIGTDDVPALRKTLAGSFQDPSQRDHLMSSGRPVRAHTKKDWVDSGDSYESSGVWALFRNEHA